jgi:hypothetical protein
MTVCRAFAASAFAVALICLGLAMLAGVAAWWDHQWLKHGFPFIALGYLAAWAGDKLRDW